MRVDGVDVVLDHPTWQRHWEKSALGIPIGGALRLAPEEVVFMHDHRGAPWPSEDWLIKAIADDPDLLQRSESLAALRAPGNLVVLGSAIPHIEGGHTMAKGTWALRWHREHHPSNDQPTAEVAWAKANDRLDWLALDAWRTEVEANGRLAEMLVVDEEFSVVTYRICIADPTGDRRPPSSFDSSERRRLSDAISSSPTSAPGRFFRDGNDWIFEGAGLPIQRGRSLTEAEVEAILHLIDGDHDDAIGGVATVLADLLERGCSIRSGFKYGTRWRAYRGSVGDGHAPWLVQPSSSAPEDWSDACLAARLAAGVNKIWCTSLEDGEGIRYISIERPPPDSRWTNPQRR